MFRGNSLGMYLDKTPTKHKRRPSSSIKPELQANTSFPVQKDPGHKSGVWRVRLDRYSRPHGQSKSHRINHSSISGSTIPLPQTTPPQNQQPLNKPSDKIRISPRFRRINNSKHPKPSILDGSLSTNCTDLVEPHIAYFKSSQGLWDSTTTCDGLLDLYRDYHNDMKQAYFMAKHIKVDVMKPINLKKKVKLNKMVILDLDETLVHCVFGAPQAEVKLAVMVYGESVPTGINVRPQCRWFLEELSKIAEIGIWTASQQNYADAVLNYLDPQNLYISHRMYRDHCTFAYGVHLKDLRRINRSLDSLVIADNSVFSFLLQMENGVPVHPYFQGEEDRELSKLFEYLKVLLKQPDVRVMNREHLALERFKSHTNNLVCSRQLK